MHISYNHKTFIKNYIVLYKCSHAIYILTPFYF